MRNINITPPPHISSAQSPFFAVNEVLVETPRVVYCLNVSVVVLANFGGVVLRPPRERGARGSEAPGNITLGEDTKASHAEME